MASSTPSAPGTAGLPKPAVRLFDESFDPMHRLAYGLYVVLAADGGVRVGVAHTGLHKFVVLEEYPAGQPVYQPLNQLAGPDPAAEVPVKADRPASLPALAALRALAAHHPWLGLRGWGRIRVAVQHERFTLLPGFLYRPADAPALLALHCEFDPAHERAAAHPHTAADITSVFAVSQELGDWLQATYGAGAPRLLHHTDALLAAALHRADASAPVSMGLHVLAGLLTLTVTRGRHLIFANVFRFTTSEELIYYTLLVLQEMGLTPEQVPVTVWGDLAPDSALLAVLRRYVRTVRLGTRPPDVQYGYRFDDAFPHRFAEVFGLHLCE